jgi:crotonobetainyl-CoA:carnitine CoA-transferase CaiB-like acyl-CoA transferase
MTHVLDNIRVLDLSRFIAGPLCAQLLGDMGAEVIKVERPGGEDARHHAPFVEDESLYTMMYNRNKHAITLNTRSEQALEILERLVVDCDVFVENYRPGTLEAMGLGHERLLELNPRLVVTSISGFGQTGPDSQRPLFDAIAQAMSGLMSVTGQPDGEPTLTGTFVADYISGYYGALGTMFALFHRERTGEGQIVDVASLDTLFATLGTRPSQQAMFGTSPGRNGSRDLLTAPARVFRCRDGHLYLHGGTNPLFPRLCDAMGRPELKEDPRFTTIPDRMRHVDEIEAEVQAWTEANDLQTVCDALTEAGVPFGPVATIADVVESPQLAAREMLQRVEHSTVGEVVLPGIPVKLSGTPGAIRKAPPVVGEDNAEVYGRLLGFDEERLESLRRDGVI